MTDTPFAPDLMRGSHILVTGGGSGLGRSMAERLARLGASISVCGRRRARLDETVDALRAVGADAVGHTCDLKEADAVEACVAAVEADLGPITHLINNAAGNFLAFTEDIGPRGFDAIVRTNLHGTFYATQACGRRWIERKHPGVVLSIATTYAESGSAYLVPSAVSKAGVVALMRSLAVEWGQFGIRLNAIAPGPIPTKGAWSRLVPEGLDEQLQRRVPLGRYGTRDELGHLAVFLLSELSAYVSGEVIALDGAEHLASGGWFNQMTQRPREELETWFASLRPTPSDAPRRSVDGQTE